jgi:hypothetical protein
VNSGKKDTRKDGNSTKKTVNPKRKFFLLVIAGLIAIGFGIGGFVLISASNDRMEVDEESRSQNITGKWLDIHGIGIYPKEENGSSGSLYLATHNGLFEKKGRTSGWTPIGYDKSDLMGFTINPNEEGVMYSSGHPSTSGGNLGFRISNDYGKTWHKVSDVTSLPIDFHTMTIGQNPETIYAASGEGDIIYISNDEGRTWTKASPPSTGERVITLTANKTDSGIVYASTTNGLFSSTNQGKSWQKVHVPLIAEGSIVSGLEISHDGKTAYAFVIPNQDENGFVIKSSDGTNTWTKTDGQVNGAKFASRFAFGNSGEVYVIVNQDANDGKGSIASSVYSSNDKGKTWTLEGTNSKLN